MNSNSKEPVSESVDSTQAIQTDAIDTPPAKEGNWWDGQFGKPGELHSECNRGQRKLSDIGG